MFVIVKIISIATFYVSLAINIIKMNQDQINYNLKDKPLIQRKYNLYVDIMLKGGQLEVGQKLNSFFGQIGVFENTEKIIDFIKEYIVSYSSINDFFFDNVEYSEEEYSENLENSFIESEDNIIYLPLTMVFYYGEKKVDFFVYSSWFKNSKAKNIKTSYIYNYLILLNYRNSSFKNLFFYIKSIQYNNLLRWLAEEKFTSKYFTFLKKTFTSFFIEEDLFTDYYDEYMNYLFKIGKRRFFFKKLKLRNKSTIVKINKKFSSISENYSLYFMFAKLSFFDNNVNDFSLLTEYIRDISQIYTFKFLFLKRFKRKKRFKRNIIKNFDGKKFTFYKVLNSIEEKKKKKKK